MQKQAQVQPSLWQELLSVQEVNPSFKLKRRIRHSSRETNLVIICLMEWGLFMELLKRYDSSDWKASSDRNRAFCLQSGHLYTSRSQVIVTGLERKFKIKIRQVITFGLKSWNLWLLQEGDNPRTETLLEAFPSREFMQRRTGACKNIRKGDSKKKQAGSRGKNIRE